MTASALPLDVQTMEAALFYAPGDVRFESTDKPAPGPGELVIQIKAALTCGTDLKTFKRGHPVLLKNFPSLFGHEGAGIVTAIGEGVSEFKPGDRLVPANSAPCLDCFFCQRQQFNLCEHLDLLNGTYAQYLKIPAPIVARNTWPIPQTLPFETAAFAEPLAICLRGIEACHIEPGMSVLVMGLGSIGLLLCKLAKRAGATVVGIGRNPLKIELAHRFSEVDAVASLPDPSSGEINAFLNRYSPSGKGFDVVIEAIGQPFTWEMAVSFVRRGGLVNLFGGCERGSSVTFDTRRLHYDEISLISLFHHTPKHFQEAVSLLSKTEIDPIPLITQRMPMSEIVTALQRMEAGHAVKVALFPDAE